MADPDIVIRLRKLSAVLQEGRWTTLSATVTQAVAEIERLRAERDAAYAAYSTAEATALELFTQRVAVRKALDIALYEGEG